MKAIFSGGGVPLSRVLREHRSALLPLAVVLAINLVVLVPSCLPLSQRVATNEARARRRPSGSRPPAEAEFKQAEAFREGQGAGDDGSRDVLREGAARRTSPRRVASRTCKPQQQAREHGVQYERGATEEETDRRFQPGAADRVDDAVGDYGRHSRVHLQLETSADFVVIDNVVIQRERRAGNARCRSTLDLSTYYRATAQSGARAEDHGR